MAYIDIQNVTYTYPLTKTPSIADVNLSFERGKFYAILGANGSGKTTLCNIIRGFIPNFFQGEMKGKVIIDGKNLEEYEMGEIASKIGYVFQNPFNQITGARDTVYGEIAYGLENFGVPVAEIKTRVEKIMEITNTTYLQEKNPFELSGGQQQRVALASVLVLEPDILVIDEPTSQLDPQETERVFEIIKTMKQMGKTIILVEHKMELVAEYCDEVVVLHQGKVIRHGDKHDVLSEIELEKFGVMLPLTVYLANELKKHGIIEFKDVSFQYPNGFSAVENVSFEINEGEAIAIIGQNGAGKTTTVKMINGLLKPTHGTVLIDGMDTKDYTTAQLSKIAGYVFQNPDDQIFHNNVEDEIRFGPKKQGLSEEEIVKKTEWAAKLCGLSEQMQENPYNLPLSIRKFVSIASVLAMDDKILILDEPTAGQDLIGINRLENILTELKKENKTVVTITHDMEFAVNNFKKIFVMSHKNLLRVGNAKEIFSDDELLKDSMLKKTYIGDLCDRLNLNETAVTIEEFLKYFV